MTAGTNAKPAMALADWGQCRSSYPGLQAQLWDKDVLYASHGYTLLSCQMEAGDLGQASENRWQVVGTFRPSWWRNLSSSTRLTARWFADGLHALAVFPDSHYVGAVAEAVVRMAPGEHEFSVSHVLRNASLRSFAVTLDQKVVWGEWFHHPGAREARVYVSEDQGLTWEVAYTARHSGRGGFTTVVVDASEDAILAIITDAELPSRMLRISSDFGKVESVLSDREGLCVGAVVPTKDGVYFAAEGPKGRYSLNRLERTGALTRLVSIPSPVTSGCQVGDWVFFATEGAATLPKSKQSVGIYGSPNGHIWHQVLAWGGGKGIFLRARCTVAPGKNTSSVLAVSADGVFRAGLETALWSMPPM